MAIEDFIKKYAGVTEEYKFYKGEVTLRYDVKNHKYLLVTPSGLEEQDGVTTICHIIDKSAPLMNWAVKMMAQQILDDMPFDTLKHSGEKVIEALSYPEFEKLVLEAKKAKDEHLEDAGTVGNAAHDWIEKYIKFKLGLLPNMPEMPDDERAKNCCLAMYDWAKAHNVRFIHTEQKVYSRIWGYAGTMDGLATVDSCANPKCCPHPFTDRLSILDWKTSNHLYLEYIYQTAAYQGAWIEMQSVEDPHSKPVTDRWVIRLGKDDAEFDPWHFEWDDFASDFEGFKHCLALSRSVAQVQARIDAKESAESAERKQARIEARAAQERLGAEERSLRRAEKRQARVEALAKNCGKKLYKGKRPPSCTTNNGKPCLTCAAKYGTLKTLAKPQLNV